MSSVKPLLKAAGEAIKQQKWNEAAEQARNVLAKDAKNYQAHIFLAYALHSQSKLDEAGQLYQAATALKPSDPQAWQGLIRVYEKQPQNVSTKLAAYQDAATHLASIFLEAPDLDRAQDVVDKFLDFARTHGSREQLARALDIILPEQSAGGLYSGLAGRVPHPASTYETAAQLLESEERKRINTLIGERRTRIGARIGDVTAEVKREVLGQSRLGHVYRQLIVWAREDDVRRTYEEKLLQLSYDRLLVFAPGPGKEEEQREVVKLAREMVIIKHPYKLAWDIAIDWQDHPDIGEWDFGVLREYCAFFPDSDLCRVLNGFLSSDISPFPKLDPAAEEEERKPSKSGAASGEESEDDDDGGVATSYLPVTEEDRLVMMTDGVSTANSLLAFRLMGEYYQHIEEHESNVELMRKALDQRTEKRTQTGLDFRHYGDAYTLYLGTALVYWQSPRHHQEAKGLFDSVLERDPSSTAALIGVGLIYEEEEEYDEARAFLDRAAARDPENLRVRAEAAWVTALKGDYAEAKVELEPCIELMESAVAASTKKSSQGQHQSQQQQQKTAKELLALTQYRLGVCIWEVDPSSRGSRKGPATAYTLWLAALHNDLGLAPAYTHLGLFYADYARDRKRAQRCFQKAVELSASEVLAAERLARSFADQGDWERVELVAQRVVDSGKVRPPPGSKRKGIAWPLAALGVAALNRLEHATAVASFQAALRIEPADYHAWVGLGESYYASGRYVAATKAIENAIKQVEEVTASGGGGGGDDAWFAQFMLANVKRELGEYDAAGELYETVLQRRPDEDGVTMALLQTRVESALDSLEKGLYGKAVQLASETIRFAATITASHLREAFNFWKSVGDACAIFSSIQSRASDLPTAELQSLLGKDETLPEYSYFQDVDGVGTGVVFAKGLYSADESLGVNLTRNLHGAILAHKRAVHCAARDVHAQAVSYYNLGWAELRAHSCLMGAPTANAATAKAMAIATASAESKAPRNNSTSRYLTAAVRCFKRAIELEAGNAAFWNALGVATSSIAPRVAQHAFARSLYLDERGPQAWTNLGVLALLQEDVRLANEAFTRAQSADPDYAEPWLGQALVALRVGGDSAIREARGLFTHALGLAGGESVLAKRLYPASLFDQLATAPPQQQAGSGSTIATTTAMIQAIFALGQLRALRPQDTESLHLSALLQERLASDDTARAVAALQTLCERLETEFDTNDASRARARFAMAQADLARAHLAAHDFDAAAKAGRMALRLTGGQGDHDDSREDDGRSNEDQSDSGVAPLPSSSSSLTPAERTRVRVSAHLTVGLTPQRPHDAVRKVSHFETALAESGDSADAVCLLAQVLWAGGAFGDEEARERARGILFEVVERQPTHVQAVVLLGVIALLDEDVESREAVAAELQGLRGSGEGAVAGEAAQAQIGEVLMAMAALGENGDGEEEGEDESSAAVLAQVQTDIMLYPQLPHGWSELAAVSGEESPAEMALEVALKTVPPRGSLGAEDIARAYASTTRAADAQSAIVIAPWAPDGWTFLADAIESAS